MLIYGNTPRDIMKMMWRRRIKMLSIIVVIAVAVMLMGCNTAKKATPKLGDGLNKFWDTLGGKVMTKSKDE
jgi:predicted small secreted protein